MRRTVPTWCLVLWPGSDLPACIPLGDLGSALARGAVLVAKEDPELTGLVSMFEPYIDTRKPRLRIEGED